MAETSATSHLRPRAMTLTLANLALWAALLALGALVAAQIVFFAVHAAHMLGYRYPLDYGEGPLLAQVNLVRAGLPIWRLYADPDLPPYAVVNYPPVYHLAAAALALATGDTLLAGRLVSLASALAAVAALWALSSPLSEKARLGTKTMDDRRPPMEVQPQSSIVYRLSSGATQANLLRALIVLAFLALPIVREWAVVMRVDMLGVCLGLWGLVIVQRRAGSRGVLWAALPLVLSLLVKPSLIAAPCAALLWLLFRDWRRALVLGLLLAVSGGLAVALIQIGSGGWFALHVLAANANVWDRNLARGFWHDQLLILWPLVAAPALGAAMGLFGQKPGSRRQETGDRRQETRLLPLYYALFGVVVAFGVGKVGAYTNYFLEFYAGLIWLAAGTVGREARGNRRGARNELSSIVGRLSSIVYRLSSLAPALVALLVGGALLRYYPTWSESYLKLAGIIEGVNPPRVTLGSYGVWQDLRRERDILAALARINTALDAEVRGASAPIFTDVPGVVAQSAQLARIQAFEHRQLFDAGLWDQRPLLRELANGRVPLVVLDYLGNWLTPEMIALITHRYAQDGSRGTYDLYRPVDPGPAATTDLAFPAGVRLVGYHLVPSPGRAAYHPGEIVLLTLDWRQDARIGNQEARTGSAFEVVTQIADSQGQVVLETARPLLYGALPPGDWGDGVAQHMQPIVLPPDLPAQSYQIAVTLRTAGRDLAPVRPITKLTVEEQGGRQIGEGGYDVPGPLLEAWARLGGDEAVGPGDPLTPAVPFAGFTQQCFVRACLRLAGDMVERLPLGDLVHLGDVGLQLEPGASGAPPYTLDGDFLSYWHASGGEGSLGLPVTPALIRADRIVQYTRYARLERPREGGEVWLGRLGEEFLRLPGGVPYRWP